MLERENHRRLPAAFTGEMPSVIRRKFFQTVAGPDDEPYPERPESAADVNPTVYYATMLKDPTYDQEVGYQGLVVSATPKKVFIYNLNPDHYVEEGTKIVGWEINNRWWTHGRAGDALFLVKFDEDIAQGASGSFTFWRREGDAAKGEETEQTDEKGSGYARLGSVVAETFGYVTWIDGGWEILLSLGGGSCTPQNAIHDYTIIGQPTGGSLSIDLEVSGVTSTLSFGYSATAPEVQAALQAHSEIGSGDVMVTAGPFPHATIRVEFTGDLSNTAVPLPTANWNSLAGDGAVAVICAMAQKGVS